MKGIFLVFTILLFSVTAVHAVEQAGQVEEVGTVVEAGQVEEVQAKQVGQVKPVGQQPGQAEQVVQVVQTEPKEQVVSLWEKIRIKIEKITPQKKPSVTTAVGGVRGAKNESGKELYWKGEAVEPKVTEQELAKFDMALKKVEEGDVDAARQLFENFVTEFSESDLKHDALLALREIDNADSSN